MLGRGRGKDNRQKQKFGPGLIFFPSFPCVIVWGSQEKKKTKGLLFACKRNWQGLWRERERVERGGVYGEGERQR